ncbi:MAG: DNA polymerase III subunit beta [Thermodesulfobacteriota bacterium]
MELTVRKEDMVKGLGKSQSVVERRTSMPILSNVLLEAEGDRLIVAATDLETSFKGECAARVSKPGKVTVPARKLYEIVKELPADEIYLKEKSNNFLHLSAGRASFDLVGLSAEDFPNLPKVAGMSQLSLGGPVLAEMIEKTIFSISQEDTRYNLAGLFVQQRKSDDKFYLRFVSTDGHRLSLVDRSFEGMEDLSLGNGVIIPRKGVAEMRKMAEESEELRLGLSQSYATLTQDQSKLILRIQEGSFPDYEVVIPKVIKKSVVANRQAFADVLRRVAILATDRFQGVKLDFKEGLLEVISQNPDLGEAREALEVDYDGDALSVGFNARYFMELCAAMRSEEVTLGFVDEQHPCLIKGEADEGFISVIMPMRL